MPTAGRRAPPAHRPPARRGRAGLGAGLAPARLRRAGARARPVRHGRGRRAGARAAAPDHHAAATGWTTSASCPTGPARSSCSTCRRTSTTTPTLPEPVQVTDGDADCADVAWRPDGGVLAFVSARHARRRPRPGHATSTRCRAAGAGAPAGHRRPRAAPSRPRRPTAGRCRHRRPDWARGRTSSRGTCALPGGPTAARCTRAHRSSDHRGARRRRTVWSTRRARRRCERRGAVELLRVPLDGSAAGRRWSTGPSDVRRLRAPAAGVVVAMVARPSAGELVASRRRRRLLTDFGGLGAPAAAAAGRADRRPRPTATRCTAGWTCPTGAGPHPVLLISTAARSRSTAGRLFDEAQVYAAAGYAVVVQPARVVRLRRRRTAAPIGGAWRARRRRRPRPARRRAGGPGARRRPRRRHGRLVRRLPDRRC